MSEIVNPILNRHLVKWPQMRVAGKPVTEEQAKEIIRRTDTFFGWSGGGNDKQWNREIRRILGIPVYWFDLEPHEREQLDHVQNMQLEQAWRKRWGVIETEYIRNSWLSCAYVGGPHGWCHPSGLLKFKDNIGKWPDGDTVYQEWVQLAQAFPFIQLGVTLMDEDAEGRPTHPVMSFHIQDGAVEIVDPEGRDVLQPYRKFVPEGFDQADVTSYVSALLLDARYREHGIPMPWIVEWSKLNEKLEQEQPLEMLAKALEAANE